MNREVQERIVAMYFDNEDFEKNAKTTIDTLEQLKGSLDIGKEAEKGFSIFEKIGKTLNFDKANQGLTKMKSTLGTMKDMFKKVFNLGPIDDAYRALDNFKTRYFDRVLGFDIAGKLVSNLENAFRSLTIAPVSAGWDQYQSKMDSVKTIMSSTGEAMEVVEQHLQSMTEYANKTIYSLTDMTSNLGKFTNNGVKLEDAVKAMEGIANATADAGQGAQSASMAMYNISQAMGVGKMTTIDWKSLENANIATVKLKDTFLEMAAAQGKLRKETKQVGDEIKTSYWLETDEEGKKLKKAVELNASNFREYLSKGWLDKETMLRTFMLYSGEGVTQNDLDKWGIHDKEEQKRLLQIGQEAMEAATQVRTFTKMMDALKESVQSGWAESFQIIFGNMEQGTQLWTKINDKFDSVLTAITNKRNKVLKEWAETDEEGRSIWEKDGNNNSVLRKGAKGGRDILIEAVFELMDVVKDLGSAVSKTFKSVFGELDGKKLMDLTVKFRDLVKGIKEWFGSMDDSESRISKMMKALKGVLNIIKVVLRALKVGANWVIGKLGPVFDWILDKFSWLGGFFHNGFGNMDLTKIPAYLGTVLQKVWEKIKSVFKSSDGETDSPFVSWIKNVWKGFKKAIKDFASQLGLGGVITSVSNAWNNIIGWSGWQDIGDFFGDIWKWLEKTCNVVINWFKPIGEGEDSPFVTFINGIWEAITGFWDGTIMPAVESVWKPIGLFASNTWEWIKTQFTAPTETDQTGQQTTGRPPIVEWLDNIWKSISDFWNNTILPAADSVWKPVSQFLGNTWEWIKSQFTPTHLADENGHELKTGSQPPVVTWLQDIWSGIQDAWNAIVNWEFWGNVAAFAANTWNWLCSQFTPTRYADENGHELKNQQAPVVTWLQNIWDSIKSVWDKLSRWEGWQEIGNFFSNVWSWIMNVVNGGGEGETAQNESKSTNVAALKQKAKESQEAVKPTEQTVGFFERIISAVGGFIEKVKGVIGELTGTTELITFLDGLGEFFSGLLEWVGKILSGLGNAMKTGDLSGLQSLIIPGLIVVIGLVGNFLNNRYMSKIGDTQNIAQKFLEIAGGMFLLASGVALLTTIDPDKMWGAVGVMVVLGAVVGTITGIIAKLEKNATARAAVGSGERILTNLINTVGKIGMVATAMALLPGIIKAIGEMEAAGAKNIGDDVLKTMEGMVVMIGGVSLVFAVLQKLSGNQGLDPTATFKTLVSVVEIIAVLSAVVMAVGGLAEAADGIFGDGSHEAIMGAMNKAADFFQGLGEALSSFVRGLLGQKSELGKTTEAMSQFEIIAQAAEKLDSEKISGVARLANLLQTLTNGSLNIEPGKLTNFAEAMGKFGAAIYEYARYLSLEDVGNVLTQLADPSTEIYNKMITFTDFGKRLGEMIRTFSGTSVTQMLEKLQILAGADTIKEFINNMQVILNALGTLEDPNEGIHFDGLTIVTKLYEAIQTGLLDPSLPKFDATSVIDDIVEAIGLGETAIATAVHAMVQQGIDASQTGNNGQGYTLNDDQTDIVKKILGSGGDMTNLINLDSLKEQFYGKDGTGGILGEINGMEDKIPSMADMFKGKGWMDFKDADGNEIDILSSVQDHLKELGTTLDEMGPLKITITPVLSYENLNPEYIQGQLDTMPIALRTGVDGQSIMVDFSGLEQKIDLQSIRERLDNITNAVAVSMITTAAAIGNLADHMDGIAAEVASLELRLDTGALVGEITPMIDIELQNNAVIGERTGV